MEHNHTVKIVETYQKLLALTNSTEPNKELLDILFDVYSFAYEAGETEQRERVHLFFPSLINKENLLKKCHGEIPLEEDEDE